MIAFIRASFPGTPASQMWSDTVATNWMDPNIPFSMAHFWRTATFQQVDMANVIFPPVTVNDPRTGAADDRDRLVRAVLVAVENASHPNWNQFDRCIIFFAQQTDLFGGGAHKAPNGKLITAAVFDLLSGFDQTCQEVGHAFGLSHELDAAYNEYGCPYSIMSAAADFSFDRGPNPLLPGVQGPTNPARIVGPYIPAAHLYINQYRAVNPNGVFNHLDSVEYVPATYAQTPVNVRLYARDVAIGAWPNRRKVLVVVPPNVPGGDTHFLELRRKDSSYDAGIGNASIILLAGNFFVGSGAVPDPAAVRLRFVGRIDLEAAAGDLDFHSFSGHFVVRVSDFAPGFASVNLSIGGGNAWQDFRITLEETMTNVLPVGTGDWHRALVAPCPIGATREFNFRVKTFRTFLVLQARSAGYEAPAYSWKVHGIPLNPAAGNTLNLQVQCRDNSGHMMNAPAMHPVQCTFTVNGGRLELMIDGALADIVLGIEVTVNESSPSVMKNYYPSRTLWTTVRADNLAIEWDGEYQAAAEACWRRLKKLSNQIPELVIPPHGNPGDPDPPYFEKIGVRELIRVLVASDPFVARTVAGVVADRAAVSVEQVLEAALRNTRNA
ncbi:hypothetical protein SAMN05216345_11494 [Cupriavidus sp. YR651]|uniref:hypothetical protein n=1 Tax=Cupriavidus sp. YR651 TaxID=1855315 RepID=UPI000891A2A0|nr:hypothetical protein [Cupriavidus sp. YR651]SDD73167.1 hypothetical protein SAMN05216345_11494 [Cupriavidus sp. YR651]